MSLKAFHVFFIVIALIFSAWFGVWGIRSYLDSGELGDLLMGIGSILVCIGLGFYFRWFLRKLKDESYL